MEQLTAMFECLPKNRTEARQLAAMREFGVLEPNIIVENSPERTSTVPITGSWFSSRVRTHLQKRR